MVTRRQLLDLGLTPKEIERGVATARLHPAWRGIYALGRPELSPEGRWLAAVLACGSGAVLTHGSAATLWGLGGYERDRIEVTVPEGSVRRRPGIRVHRRALSWRHDRTEHERIPVTTALRTVIDMASRLTDRGVEKMINEGANRELFSPDELRAEIARRPSLRGGPRLRRVLDRRTFRLTRSELERRFLRLARQAGLPEPDTRVWLNGFETDFYFRDIGLVVETDGLRFHRTPAQQARDRLRDQAHAAAGLTPLRFTHGQVRYDSDHVRRTLVTIAARLARLKD